LRAVANVTKHFTAVITSLSA